MVALGVGVLELSRLVSVVGWRSCISVVRYDESVVV